MRSNFAKLVRFLSKSFPNADLKVVRRAYRVAVDAHEGQTRLSGEPYVIHAVKVGQILASLGLDPAICAAGLLHDVLEDTEITHADLAKEFGEEIANLVEGVTKLSNLHYKGEAITREDKQAQNIRKMLVATAKDVRVILIKLADRLHNMRTIEFLPPEKQERIARETMDIYAPLAHRLGISNWKWELEDRSFHVLQPMEYKRIARQVNMKRRDREKWLLETCLQIQQKLASANVEATVLGRPKHLYSIYQKMVSNAKDFDEVMDVMGVRIITPASGDCYNALGVVHSLWTPMPGRLKDYIAMPKLNMYQAIHTTVMRENGKTMEIQIRSADMDRTAREGIAAHWIYKEGENGHDRKLDEQLKWLQQMHEWLKDAHGQDELMDSMRRDFRAQYVYAFTPKGAVKELPAGATPLDFAYLIHSAVGHHCIGARVNGRMVPLHYHIQTGDIVDILTSETQYPRLEWVDIVVTGRARTRIRQRLRDQGLLDPQDDPKARAKESKDTRSAEVAVGDTGAAPRRADPRIADEASRIGLVRVDGERPGSISLARCCNPMPGEEIVAFVRQDRGVTIHRLNCHAVAKLQQDATRLRAASWEGQEIYRTAVRVVIGPRPNVLADITNALRPMNVEILHANYGPGENRLSIFDFVFETTDRAIVERVLRTLRNVSGVSDVATLDSRERPSKRYAHAN